MLTVGTADKINMRVDPHLIQNIKRIDIVGQFDHFAAKCALNGGRNER